MSQHGALHARRRRLLLAVLLLSGLALLGRGFQLQVLQASVWEGRAAGQQSEKVALPSARGTIFDRSGIPLVTTREMVRVSIAPREVRDRELLGAALRTALGMDRSAVRRALDPSRRWVVVPGRFEPTVRAQLDGITGVYIDRVLERFHPHPGVAAELIGQSSADGRGLSGLELEADSLLRGQDGYAVAGRDARGEPIPGALVPVVEPRAGHDLYLTIDLGLQEIAEQALQAAIDDHDAEGGDLIFADPRTGEVLAAASIRQGGGRHWRGVTEPYEPGSTMKPFVMAALLERGRATLTDTVYAEEGYYRVGRREIRDVEGHGWLTAGEVLRYSSNIGMVKLVERLEPHEQYAMLRDFGFGTPTGITYPSESGGRLARPGDWSGYSQASMAMGYELSVTPLQMTMAYAALANGGRLMEPRMIREVRGADGRKTAPEEPRVVRRAVSATTAASISDALADVVREGTGHRAGLGEFRVAGKTGTARTFEGGRYRTDSYTATFAGFFPAKAPQLVFLVKLDGGSEYGGSVAAPVTRATLAAALASHATPLDRRAVASVSPNRAAPIESVAGGEWLPPSQGPVVIRLDAGPPMRARRVPTAVPGVVGENPRDAAARLHASGFRVRMDGVGEVRSMSPASGTLAPTGSMVTLTLGRGL